MIYGIYVVRDIKTTFLTPTFDMNDESAIRNFSYAINNTDGILGFSPSDFDLFKIGTFDNEKGFLDKSDFLVPEFIVSGGAVFGVKGVESDV